MIDLKQALLVTYGYWPQLECNENLIPVICWALPKANDFHKARLTEKGDEKDDETKKFSLWIYSSSFNIIVNRGH